MNLENERPSKGEIANAFQIDAKKAAISVRGLGGDHEYRLEKRAFNRGDSVKISSIVQNSKLELQAVIPDELPNLPNLSNVGEIHGSNLHAHLYASQSDSGKQLKVVDDDGGQIAYGISSEPLDAALLEYRRARRCVVEFAIHDFGAIYFLIPTTTDALQSIFGERKAWWWVEYVTKCDKSLAPVAGMLAGFCQLFFRPEAIVSNYGSNE